MDNQLQAIYIDRVRFETLYQPITIVDFGLKIKLVYRSEGNELIEEAFIKDSSKYLLERLTFNMVLPHLQLISHVNVERFISAILEFGSFYFDRLLIYVDKIERVQPVFEYNDQVYKLRLNSNS